MNRSPGFASLIKNWNDRAATIREAGYIGHADGIVRMIAELDACISTVDSELLSIQRAARESAYSEEHLRRMLRNNPALNAGREGKPLIHRRDLPRKAITALASARPNLYAAVADARNLMSRQGES